MKKGLLLVALGLVLLVSGSELTGLFDVTSYLRDPKPGG